MKFFNKIQTAIKSFFFSSREERLEKAIRDNNEKRVKSLLREGDGINPEYPFLHIAADIGNEKIVDLILKMGKVDINVLNKLGESALHVAVKDGNDKVAELLIKNGINVNLLDRNGYSALHDAIFEKNENIAKLITEDPSLNLNLINQKQKLLYCCAIKSQNSTANLLLKKGLNLDEFVLENLTAKQLFALNDDAKSFLKETGSFSSDQDIENFITLSKSKAILNLSYANDDFGVSNNFANKVILASIADHDFPKKDTVLKTLEAIAGNKEIELPNGNHLLIKSVPYKSHAAFAIFEYDKSNKPIQVTYCDSNSILDLDKNGYGYGGLTFKVDQKKIAAFKGKDAKGDGWEKYLGDAFSCESSDMYKNNRENFYKTISKVVECDKNDHPIISDKSIPTKPQKRGNCALKACNVVIREILRRTDPEMVFDNVDGKQSGKGYESYQSYKKLLTENPINKLVELADPSHDKDFGYRDVINFLKENIFGKAESKGNSELLKKLKGIFNREKSEMLEIGSEKIDSKTIKNDIPSSSISSDKSVATLLVPEASENKIIQA